MQKPSDQWIKCRRATLERVVLSTIDPIRPLNTLFTTLCVIYLIGFARFSLFPVQSDAYSWIEAGQVVSTAISALMIPLFGGAVLLLAFIDKRIEKLFHAFD